MPASNVAAAHRQSQWFPCATVEESESAEGEEGQKRWLVFLDGREELMFVRVEVCGTESPKGHVEQISQSASTLPHLTNAVGAHPTAE